MRPSTLVDTGVLYAMADQDDAWHARVRAYLESQRDILVVPVTVIPEATYLLNTHLGAGAERQLLTSLLDGELRVEALVAADLKRSIALIDQYADANIGFVDASVVAIAERLKLRRLLTTDRRHFSIVKPRHCRSLELLP